MVSELWNDSILRAKQIRDEAIIRARLEPDTGLTLFENSVDIVKGNKGFIDNTELIKQIQEKERNLDRTFREKQVQIQMQHAPIDDEVERTMRINKDMVDHYDRYALSYIHYYHKIGKEYDL